LKYIIITPAKNEEAFIGITISSIISQTIQPFRYIIVDDGSDDKTVEVVRFYQEKYPWIELVHVDSKGAERSGGAKVVQAFQKGYDYLGKTGLDYDIIVKLDADLQLPAIYFEEVIQCFKQDGQLGMCGGYIKNKIGDELITEPYSDYHVRGAFKSIRRICFEQIGGFKPLWNWDSIDQVEAMSKGWKTKVIDQAVIQFRPTSAAYSATRQQFRDGYDAYCLRNNIFLVLLRTLPRITTKPYVICAFFYLAGYLKAIVNKEPLSIDKQTAKFYNKFHLTRILNALFSGSRN
jgi:glycosyltransferase involved in cell wall biosynthesis